jgi:hypothetical protein
MSSQLGPVVPAVRTHFRSAPPVQESPVGPEDAGRFLNMHPKTVLRKAREGEVPAHPVGRNRKRWHFYLSELDDWLRSQVISISHPRRQHQGDYIG